MSDASQKFEEKKFVALLTYAANKLADDPSTGLTKLYKVSYLADFAHYRGYGASITGAQYVHNHHGPTAKQTAPILRKLESGDVIDIQETLYLGMPQKKVVVHNSVDTSSLSTEELKTIDEVIELVRGRTATEISEMTHRELGWKLTEPGEEIPYFATYLGEGNTEPTPAMREFADQLRDEILS